MTPIISASGMSSPLSMCRLACVPNVVFRLISSRSISPVEMTGAFRCSPKRRDWVPLPAPGVP